MSADTTNHWPSGARDTTEFPKVNISVDVTIRDHLKAFTKMDGAGWTDYDAMNTASGSEMTGSRLRTYRKLYEKCGLIYRANGKIQLSRLGQQISVLESELEAKKDEILNSLRKTAIDILSRYQLRNPFDTDPLPDNCDILPAICIWKAMRQLENKIHPEEINRVLLRVMHMDDLDGAIEHIRKVRQSNNGCYDSEELLAKLGEPVHTNQAQARIAPWFSFVGWGGLIIEQIVDDQGYRNLTPSTIPMIDEILSNPPHFHQATDEADWIEYYIGKNTVDLSEHGCVDNELAFKEFLSSLVKADGKPYSESSRSAYISSAKAAAKEFHEQLAPYTSLYQIDDITAFDRYEKALRSAEGFDAFNDARGNGALSACLKWYRVFLDTRRVGKKDISFQTGYRCEYPRNRILFGAPGTGKSYTLNKEKDLLLADGGTYERVTFHPDYSYANFVGTYKPVPCKDSEGKDAITYSYVPGPFMRTYVKALQNSRTDTPKPFLLVIEEINRANVAAVFGDVFQLLDRGDDEVSEYPIQASQDIKKYLAGELGGNPDDYSEIRIPDNMFIWATMNSADQGVFPMDTAFKRRWDFTYLGIDDSEAGIVGKKVILGQGNYRRIVEWNALRKAINNELLTYKVNEDKLMGPYFISKKNLPEGEMIDPAGFARIFKNKVIMYLFDDAAKQKRISLFGGCDEKAKNQYSKICREFDTKGVYIFCDGISSQFIDNVPEDDGE